MKRLILAALAAAVLSGCASYGELQVACDHGDYQACVDKANRDNAFSGAAMYMQQQNQLQAQTPVIVQAPAPMPNPLPQQVIVTQMPAQAPLPRSTMEAIGGGSLNGGITGSSFQNNF